MLKLFKSIGLPPRALRNERGFSLTEILLTGGILAGVGIAASRMFSSNVIAQRNIDLDQKLSSFHSTLTKVVQDVGNCNATFKSQYGQPSLTAPTLIRTKDNIATYTGADATAYLGANAGTIVIGPTYITAGQWIDEISEFRQGASTQTWRLVSFTIAGGAIVPATPAKDRAFIVTYQLNSKIRNRTVTKRIPLFVRFISDGTFSECYSPQGSAVSNFQDSVCFGMNTTEDDIDGAVVVFDEDLQRCVLRTDPTSIKTCPAGQVLRGLDSNGQLQCMPVDEGADAVLPDTATTTVCATGEKMYLRKVAGKVTISCEP